MVNSCHCSVAAQQGAVEQSLDFSISPNRSIKIGIQFWSKAHWTLTIMTLQQIRILCQLKLLFTIYSANRPGIGNSTIAGLPIKTGYFLGFHEMVSGICCSKNLASLQRAAAKSFWMARRTDFATWRPGRPLGLNFFGVFEFPSFRR